MLTINTATPHQLTGQNALLHDPKNLFAATTLEDVTGCLAYNKPPLSVPAMDEALAQTFATRALHE